MLARMKALDIVFGSDTYSRLRANLRAGRWSRLKLTPKNCCRLLSRLTAKLIRRFGPAQPIDDSIFGTSPFFLQFSTAHPSAACGFSENSTTPFPFLFLSGATPLFPRTANWVVGVSTHWYWANEIPVVEHRGIEGLRAAGDVSRAFGPDKGSRSG
jgi:hypothetical protein